MSDQPKSIKQRINHGATVMSWPCDEDGVPMVIVCGACKDLVPTVQMGNVEIGPVTIMRPVPNGTGQDIINATREVQRIAEHVVGQERRLLQAALDPSYKFVSPFPPEQSFAAPPPGYDPASMPSHPGDVLNAKAPEKTADGSAKS